MARPLQDTAPWFFPKGITSLTVDIPSQFTTASSSSAAQSSTTTSNGLTSSTLTTRASTTTNPPRWATTEFYIYYLLFALVVPCMAYTVINLSRPSHPNYHTFAHRLSDGWIFGWKVVRPVYIHNTRNENPDPFLLSPAPPHPLKDNSDHQWYKFRTNLPLLTGVMIIWLVLAKTYDLVARIVTRHGASPSDSPSPTPASEARSNPSSQKTNLPPRVPFIIFFALILLFGLHGMSLPKMLIILALNYRIAKCATSPRFGKSVPWMTWGFNLAILFANELNDGYSWANLSPRLQHWDQAKWAQGILPRWHINWNITMLRLISFNMDYYWAANVASGETNTIRSTQEEKLELLTQALSAPPLNDRTRVNKSHPLPTYSFTTYLAYAFYPPLYLAGPILTFNSFVSQLYHPPSTISRSMLLGYGVRFLACLLTMELVLHTMYVVAIKDETRSGAWSGETPFELSMIGFWNLIVVWLKLLIPWRFFRLWALLDSIDPPENMVRCMANNYSTLGFWRSWHRSYNLWCIRYLYVPLGGAKRPLLATLTVFTFVALWHDLSLKLLTWGWVITIFVVPEMVGMKLLPAHKYSHQKWYRHICALGGVLNVHMMMTANLIGFAIGTEGMKYMWSRMVESWQGLRFITLASACLFIAVQVMFEYREEEGRRGVRRRC
ncbi:BQ2448_7231 [Microbotryum intermedium]|uniref:BQ2448_7231 protein n=1 Tax=Microbotryum intermedium TaxID=269621 RepID=A0A238FJH2_9BASI|nr:BQ2448_7231 [Microbotryum intermedium]